LTGQKKWNLPVEWKAGDSMTLTSVLLSSTVLASLLQPGLAADITHAAYLASVSTYKPMAGFNHVVGSTRFVGYFLQGPGLCRVTVFKAGADDEALVSPPERLKIDIAAAGRSELAAGDGSALAIACTADADAIKIAPQYHYPTNVTIDALDSAQE
jgi:hypothetical protein